MSVTQDYKKLTCCTGNCRQGRDCPLRKPDTECWFVTAAAAVMCVVSLGAPVALWLLGYGGM